MLVYGGCMEVSKYGKRMEEGWGDSVLRMFVLIESRIECSCTLRKK